MVRPAFSCVAFLLGGCWGGAATVPVSDTRWDEPIGINCADTASTQKKILKHDSRLDSIRSGKDVVYGNPCPVPAGQAKKEPPKTS